MSDVRRERLARSRLYFVTDLRPDLDRVLAAALEGGVDMVQLRDKEAGDEELLAAAVVFRRRCDEHGALFWLNDRPDLALRCDADGVHVGQDDEPAERCASRWARTCSSGLSTHSPEQLDAALAAVPTSSAWARCRRRPPRRAGRPPGSTTWPRRRARRRAALVRDRRDRPG